MSGENHVNQKRKSYSEYWNEFAAYNTITGFNLIAGSTYALESIVWTLLLIFGAMMTVRDIYLEIDSYMQGSVTTAITLVHTRPMVIPLATVCFPLDLSHLYIHSDFKLDPRPNNTFRYFKYRPDEKFNSTKFELIENFLQGRLINESNGNIQYGKHLLQNLGVTLCREMGFQMVKKRKNASESFNVAYGDLCVPENIFWLGPNPDFFEDDFCLNASPNDMLSFNSFPDRVHLTWLIAPWFKDTKSIRKATVSLNGGPLVTQNSRNVFRFWPSKMSQVVIERRAELNAVDNCKTDPLYSAICTINCTATLSYNNVSCVPYSYVSFLDPSTNVAFCPTFAEYPQAIPEGNVHVCVDNCQRQCTSHVYSFVVDNDDFPDESNGTKAGIRLFVGQFSNYVMNESYAMDFHSLVAQILGTMGGSWLGASMLGLLHIPIYLIRIIFDKIKYSREKSAKMKKTTAATTSNGAERPKVFSTDFHSVPELDRGSSNSLKSRDSRSVFHYFPTDLTENYDAEELSRKLLESESFQRDLRSFLVQKYYQPKY